MNVNAQPQQQQRVFEVVLTITATAKREDQHVFLAELAYGAVVSVSEDVEENIIHPLVMIEGPRLIFPFARQMISDMTQSGGYMPLNIQPIDFVRLYQSSMENQTAEAGTPLKMRAKHQTALMARPTARDKYPPFRMN